MEDPSVLARRLILAATRMDGAYYYFARHSGVPENQLALFYALSDGKPHSQKEICEDWLIPKTTINLTEAGRAYAQKTVSALCAAERAAAEQVVAKHGAGFVAAMEDFAAALWREYEACLQQTKE